MALDRVESLFHEALALPAGADRATWVADASRGDTELLQEVMALLGAHAEMNAAMAVSPAAEPVPGGAFGPYRAIRLLGRGGMSSVYLARRADGQFEQTAALKIMAGHLAGPEFLRRFETERQLLASLSHNNITRLLDGGVSSTGDPFLITEYIDGQPVDGYCDERKLDIKGRLRIFLQVCDAVEYAHRHLIVHRDLKPGNILVNAEGTVKLLDFGTASLQASPDSATVTGARLMTPRYASPEQLRGDRLSTSTDVFSLGVVLYELLCGAWPFGTPGSVLAELNRATGSVSAQPPSSTITEESAERRGAPVEQLRRILKGDLSAIVLKALENDPGHRYKSVREFAQDIHAFLDGLPVLACPQTMFYRTAKFLRRRWLSVAAAAIFTLGLSGATFEALREAKIARARYTDLRSLTTDLLFQLKDAINDVPGSTPAQRILVERVVKSLDSLAVQSAQDPALRLELAEAYRQLGELQGSPYGQNLGDPAGALANLTKARSLAGRQLAAEPNSAPSLREAAKVECTIGEVYFGTGRGNQAASHVEASVNYIEKVVQISGTIPELVDAATFHGVLGDIYGQPGTASLQDAKRSGAEYGRTMELDQMIVRKNPSTLRAQRGIAIMHFKRADLVRFDDPVAALNDYREGLHAFEQLPEQERNKPANLRLRASFWRKTGELSRDLGLWEDAVTYLGRARAFFESGLAADPEDRRAKYDVVTILEGVMLLHEQQGKLSLAIPVAERIITLMDDLVRGEPNNSNWHMSRAYYRYKLATERARMGEREIASTLGASAVNELGRIADAPDASPQAVELAAEAFSRIEPRTLRNRQRAVRYAERVGALQAKPDLHSLYLLAMAQNAESSDRDAAETARKALAMIPTTDGAKGYYVRAELEAIH